MQFACARLAGGAVTCWGANDFGQLGDGIRDDPSTPVRISGFEGATQISGGWRFTCAVLANGRNTLLRTRTTRATSPWRASAEAPADIGPAPGIPWYASWADALDDALRVIASLNAAEVEYVIIGGVALNVHGLIRATEDLEVFVRPERENIARLREALRAVWSDPEIDQITEEDLCGDYPAVRYGPPSGTLYLDILTSLGDAMRYVDLEYEEKTVNGVRVRVATPSTLYRMKKGTMRPIDHEDARALRAAFQFDEREEK